MERYRDNGVRQLFTARNNRAGQSFCEHLPGGQAAGEFEAPHQLVHRKCIWQGGDR